MRSLINVFLCGYRERTGLMYEFHTCFGFVITFSVFYFFSTNIITGLNKSKDL